MTSLAHRYLAQATVRPHWLSPSTFWYLRTSASSDNAKEFLFVDAETSSRRPAFDHANLAADLAKHTGQDVNPSSLPFSWIELDPNAAAVRFRCMETVFQYQDGEGKLEVWEGDFGTKLEPIASDAVSENGGQETGLTVINKTTSAAKVYWINSEGEAFEYATVQAGGETRLGTYAGHVWRVESDDGKSAVYRAVEGEGFIVVDMEGWKVSEEQIEATQDRAIFVRDGDVWIRDDDGEHQITTSASGGRYDADRAFVSPDGRFATVWQFTPEEGYTLNLVESTPKDQLQPKLKTRTYLKPGDKMRVDRPRMFEMQGKKEIPTESTLFQNPYSMKDIGWSKDGEEYRFEYSERGQKNLRIIGMNRQGAVRAIVDESSDTFIDYFQKSYWAVSPDDTELLWTSERDGWNHLYLYDFKTGKVKAQVTKGEWVVKKVEKVDWTTRQIWLTVCGIIPNQDPYYEHLVRVNLDSTEMTILTSGDGNHTSTWSPDNRYLIDSWSRVDQLPITVLREASSGAEIVALEADATPDLLAEGWVPPEIFTAPGRDNETPIHGIIVPPQDFDSSKTYPIIEDIYAGPHDFFTPKSFTPELSEHEVTARGFVLVKLDGMGTNWRSKAFHDVCHKNLKDGGIPDRISWIKAAAATRPWMHLARLGIYGGSAGGQNAAAALIFHGDFYKAAAADCGCHDNRLDKLWWNEQWMGWPVEESYAANSNVVHAKQLTGKLLLTVGELDDNVDPASTLQLVKALNEAEKDYEMLLMPGKGHGAGDSEYGRRRRWEFFGRWLGGGRSRG
ncbi:Alpha/Beta hydrolase protein [Podospora australis]|uniref:Probable dipeptidyl-aminopeptidase B n=1 Tax=Podospora australis TaxID=1536484 RepID=A0AAN7ABR6_9PEZI|nr:Alpha/Beta hydrolase protein [Podospora australis]